MELYAACHRNGALFVAQTNDKLERSFKSPRPGPHVFAAALLLLATGQAPTTRSRSTILEINQRGQTVRPSKPRPAWGFSKSHGTALAGSIQPKPGARENGARILALRDHTSGRHRHLGRTRFRMFDAVLASLRAVGHFCATPVNVVIPRADGLNSCTDASPGNSAIRAFTSLPVVQMCRTSLRNFNCHEGLRNHPKPRSVIPGHRFEGSPSPRGGSGPDLGTGRDLFSS
jgi:hypothetical protein